MLLAAAIVVLGFGLLMWHLLLGQRPDQTLQVIYWIAAAAVAVMGGTLVLSARTTGKKLGYVRRQEPKGTAARPGI